MYLNSVIGQKIQYQLNILSKTEWRIRCRKIWNNFTYRWKWIFENCFKFCIHCTIKDLKVLVALGFLKIAKKVNGHDTYSNSFLNSKMKVLQLSVNVDFFAVLESGENSKKAIIIHMGQEILPCHLYYHTIKREDPILCVTFPISFCEPRSCCLDLSS